MIDQHVVSAIAEERLCRMKLATGMPHQSIARVMAEAGLKAQDIDRVAVAQRVSVFESEPQAWEGCFEKEEQIKTKRYERLSTSLAPVAGCLPLAQKAHPPHVQGLH